MNLIVNLSILLIIAWCVGYERAHSNHVIGFRSISLILLGSFMYTHISTLIGGDPARIIAHIVTGVGFIGAGMIFKHDSRSIFNLTTAILVWTLSAVGVLLGLNYRLEAIVTALIIFFILSFKKQS
jgi:putative Mg2+ transporter-C (MgtC) family protein